MLIIQSKDETRRQKSERSKRPTSNAQRPTSYARGANVEHRTPNGPSRTDINAEHRRGREEETFPLNAHRFNPQSALRKCIKDQASRI